ncbi:MAG: tetratricopeptide repeat protein, partial [Aestuariivirgaceae bacterium]
MTTSIEQAETLVKSGQAAEALPLLEQILEDQPDLLQAHSLCAAALMKLDRPQEACKHLEAFVGTIDRFPNPVRARVGIAQRFADAGAFDRADELLDQAINLQPDDPAIIAKRGDVLLRGKHWCDFDRLVHSYRIDAPGDYAGLDDFNRALEAHILAHPELVTPPEDHPTWHHPALKIGSHINVVDDGPVADLEAVMEDAIERYFAHTGK